MDADLSIHHLYEFIRLWVELSNVRLHDDVEDSIRWNLTANGEYYSNSAYKAQFFGATRTVLNKLIWKAWAPPKIKFFSWLAFHNRLWTKARLQRRGRPNCGICPLCKQTQETVAHLLFQCRFAKRVWRLIKEWLGLPLLNISEWAVHNSINSWWTNMSGNNVPHRKAMASITMLTSWTIWNERNTRVFRQKSAPPPIIFGIIKSEARIWVSAGAK